MAGKSFRSGHLLFPGGEGGGKGKVFTLQILSSFWRMERVHLTDYLICVDWEILDCLSKITFSGDRDTLVKPGIKSKFGSMSFSTSDATLGLWFSL